MDIDIYLSIFIIAWPILDFRGQSESQYNGVKNTDIDKSEHHLKLCWECLLWCTHSEVLPAHQRIYKSTPFLVFTCISANIYANTDISVMGQYWPIKSGNKYSEGSLRVGCLTCLRSSQLKISSPLRSVMSWSGRNILHAGEGQPLEKPLLNSLNWCSTERLNTMSTWRSTYCCLG